MHNLVKTLSEVQNVDDTNFEEFVSGNGIAVLDFSADWCMPCKMMAPVFSSLAKEMDGAARFGRVDVDQARRLSGRFDIRGVPTFVFLKNGEIEGRIVGMTRKSQIKSRIDSLLNA